MRHALLFVVLLCLVIPARPQEDSSGLPSNEKAQKTYQDALKHLQKHEDENALEAFKKADKQDGGRCRACQVRVVKYATELHDWKAAENAVSELLAEVTTPREIAIMHYQSGMVLLEEGIDRHKDEVFSRSHEEFLKALATAPNFPDAMFADGRALAYLKQDEAAKARFQEFVKSKPNDELNLQRAQRYIEQPELARARMAPSFAVTTIDGQHISFDDLQGKVVLIDFWATWCGPCREALPHVKEIVRKFSGQPLVVLSVSLDKDAQHWREFVAKNEMTWPQYYDGGFDGPISKLFGINAIPHTFTIDADGVLQEDHMGDAALEGKLKKLLKRATEVQATKTATQTTTSTQ